MPVGAADSRIARQRGLELPFPTVVTFP